MNQSDFIVAPVLITEDKPCMAMISEGFIHIFDNSGKEIEREDLGLPEVCVLNFNDGANRSFALIQEKEVVSTGILYVIDRDNKVIFTSKDLDYNVYSRITDNTIILGVEEVNKASDVLIPTPIGGRLIENNKLTNYELVGAIGIYYLFSEIVEGNHAYILYALETECMIDPEKNKYIYNEDEYIYSVCIHFHFVNRFQYKVISLWETKYRMNIIGYEDRGFITIKGYDKDTYYGGICHINKRFPIECDLTAIDWEKDIQVLWDQESIILHHKNVSGDIKGFTLIIEYDTHDDSFTLCNQRYLGKYWHETIERYTNSLILLKEPHCDTIYDRCGNIVTQINKGYDYQNNRAEITDYAIIRADLSVPKMKSPLKHCYARYGVISTETLAMVVPPNFSEIDYIVLEQPSCKHCREKGTYEVYIKVCIEGINKQNESILLWGLYKDSECLLPCFYKSIEIRRFEDSFIFIIENHEGLKGVFHGGKVVSGCMYESIEELDYYLLMTRTDGKIDVIYFEKEGIKFFENFSSVLPASIVLNYTKKKYINKEAIIVLQNDKYGIICHGQWVVECGYDEIALINANPNMHGVRLSSNPLWFMLRKGNKVGVYGTEGTKTDIIYNQVNVIDWHTFHPDREGNDSRYFILRLDEGFYTTEEMTLICNDKNLVFRGFLSSTVLVFAGCDGRTLQLYDYNGTQKDYVVVDSNGVIVFTSTSSSDAICSQGKYAVIQDSGSYCSYKHKELAFSFEENKIVYNPFFHDIYEDEDNGDDNEFCSTDYPDDTDYERDTYYALGGDDYDEWRNNGGNLDDMMDGMGF